MSAVIDDLSKAPVDDSGARLTYKTPQARRDEHGDLPPRQREDEAVRGFVNEFGRTAALYLESCIHCGMCAEACHFYEATHDPRYTPIWKVEPFKQAYKREHGPFALFFKALGLKRPISAEQLEQWQELMYDACTLCGRCSLMCPMGIDIAGLIGVAREGMARAGLVPDELWAAAERAQKDGSAFGISSADFKQRIEALSREHGVPMPVDQGKAEILATVTAVDLLKYPAAVVALARVLQHLKASWTFDSRAFEASNVGLVSGREDVQRGITLKLVAAAERAGAKVLLVPECGHAYGALRWDAANVIGRELPFRVLHVTELMADALRDGRLKLRRADGSVTFHDPCQVVRRGGVVEAPRQILAALGMPLKEMWPTKATQWCCGGGGGVIVNRRADGLRRKMFRIKLEQLEHAGAQRAVTSCSNCRQSFDDGGAHHHWDGRMESLLELVAAHLADGPAARNATGR